MKKHSGQVKPLCKPAKLVANMTQKRDALEHKSKLKGVVIGRKSSDIIRFDRITGHVGIERCVAFMIQKFNRPIQLKDLVRVSGMSRRGFSKAFYSHTGANPGAVLKQIRIEHAKRILAKHDLTLKAIARRCGYRSENTFCVAFQRSTGLAPKKFQIQYWLAINNNHRKNENLPSIIKNFLRSLDKMGPTRFNNSKLLANSILNETCVSKRNRHPLRRFEF